MQSLKIKMSGLGLLAWSSFAFSEGCHSYSKTRDISACIMRSYEKIDVRLNAQYKEVLSSVSPSYRKNILEGGRAWIKYRDVHCENIFQSIFPGEEAGIERLNCLATLTSLRVSELLYIETGIHNGGFYNSLSLMSKLSSKTSDQIIDQIISKPAGSIEEVEYFYRNCELTGLIYEENKQACQARMKLQNR